MIAKGGRERLVGVPKKIYVKSFSPLETLGIPDILNCAHINAHCEIVLSKTRYF